MTLHIRPTPLTSGGLRDTGGYILTTPMCVLNPLQQVLLKRDTSLVFNSLRPHVAVQIRFDTSNQGVTLWVSPHS